MNGSPEQVQMLGSKGWGPQRDYTCYCQGSLPDFDQELMRQELGRRAGQREAPLPGLAGVWLLGYTDSWPQFLLPPRVLGHTISLFCPLKGLTGFLFLLLHLGVSHVTSLGH